MLVNGDNMSLPERKEIRLHNYDYSASGAYFITVCTQNKVKVLSEILPVGDGFPVPRLTTYGKLAEVYINRVNEKYPNVKVCKYIIMPDHIHLLLTVEDPSGGTGDPSPTTGMVLGWFKYQTTKEINRFSGSAGTRFWQRSFFDHIVRNQQDFEDIWNYIETNPQRWIEKYKK